MALSIDPAAGTFPAGGGTATHQVENTTETRLAFKVCSPHYMVFRKVDPT